MPDEVSAWLYANKDALWNGLVTLILSATGSYLAVSLKIIAGSNMTEREVWTTMLAGTVFGMVFSGVIGSFIGIPAGVSLPMGGGAVISGMLGMPLAKRFMQLGVTIGGEDKR